MIKKLGRLVKGLMKHRKINSGRESKIVYNVLGFEIMVMIQKSE